MSTLEQQREESARAEEEQTRLWELLKATDPSPSPDTLYDTWATFLHEAGVRAPEERP